MPEHNGRIVHRGSAVAQPRIHPIGKQVRVSTTMQQLMDDFRQAACQFGMATDAKDVEAAFEKMQMRYYDLAYQVNLLEYMAGQTRDAVMKF